MKVANELGQEPDMSIGCDCTNAQSPPNRYINMNAVSRQKMVSVYIYINFCAEGDFGVWGHE